MNSRIAQAFALIVIIALGWGGWMYYNGGSSLDDLKPKAPMPSDADLTGSKVLYIDSYHEGYDWSDGITRGIQTVFEGTGAELRVFRMDTKNNTTEPYKLQAAAEAKALIESFKPDVVIVSDDNAFKYVVQASYKHADIPFVFNGLNWDASIYDAPYTNTTGMVEVSLTNQIIDHLRQFASGDKVGFISADNETERKNVTYYDKLLGIRFDKVYHVKDMSEWKRDFKKLQSEVDIIIFENNAGIANWDDQEAGRFALENTVVPVGTTNPWIMPFALLGITKVAEEQGEWAAQTAIRILKGETPASIPLVKNKQGNLIVNLKIADKLGVTFSPSVLKNAEVLE